MNCIWEIPGYQSMPNLQFCKSLGRNAMFTINALRRKVWWLAVLMVVVAGCSQTKKIEVMAAGTKKTQPQCKTKEHRFDSDFVAHLSSAGIFDAARQIGLDIDKYLMPLAQRVDHPYRRYRWSVGYHEKGGRMISALPPEEESGWIAWERWYKDDDGKLRRESWVMYPLKKPTAAGVAKWYRLDEDDDLTARFLRQPASLEEKLRLARVYEAARVLGFDAEEVLIKPLSPQGRKRYRQCRWVVIPHILAADTPVIYVLPPMNLSDKWPWESWYTDGKVPLIHHVHYTKSTPLTVGSWQEYPGAPQRPPEIFGVTWYWYDDLNLVPTMAKP